MIASKPHGVVPDAVPYPEAKSKPWPFGLLLATLVALYTPVFLETSRLWQSDEYSAHGVFIPFLSGLLLWWKREEIARVTRKPSAWGFAPFVLGLAMQSLAWYTRINLFATLSVIPVLIGVTLLLGGTRILRILLFPILFLTFSAPMPRWMVQPLSLPVQTLSVDAASSTVRWLGVPMLKEGFNVRLPNTTVEVAEECSGFKKTLSLMVFACFYVSLFAIPFWRQAVLVLLALPIALCANILRVSALIFCGYKWGDAGVHTFHDPSEAIALVLCALMLWGAGKALGCKKVRYIA